MRLHFALTYDRPAQPTNLALRTVVLYIYIYSMARRPEQRVQSLSTPAAISYAAVILVLTSTAASKTTESVHLVSLNHRRLASVLSLLQHRRVIGDLPDDQVEPQRIQSRAGAARAVEM